MVHAKQLPWSRRALRPVETRDQGLHGTEFPVICGQDYVFLDAAVLLRRGGGEAVRAATIVEVIR